MNQDYEEKILKQLDEMSETFRRMRDASVADDLNRREQHTSKPTEKFKSSEPVSQHIYP